MKKEVTFSILLVAALLVVILIERKVELQKEREFGAPKKEAALLTEMAITSGDFIESGYIPARFTCDGENIHPSLEFSGVPEDAVTLALIVEDNEVSKSLSTDGVWDHLVVYDIPNDTTKVIPGEKIDGTYGMNSKGEMGYAGPCSDDKVHRYIFRLYALDTKLGLAEGSTKKTVTEAMKGHTIRQSSLIGLYDKTAPKTVETIDTDVTKTPTL